MKFEAIEKEGKSYAHVTSIISVINAPFLAKWRGNVGNAEADRICKATADDGKYFHSVISEFNQLISEVKLYKPKGKEFLLKMQNEPEFGLDFENYTKWFWDNVLEVLATETLYYNEKLLFAGKPDIIVEMTDGKVAVIELKYTNQIQKPYKLQLSGYQHLETPFKIDRRLVLRFKKGDFEPVEYPDHLKDYSSFLNCLSLYKEGYGI